jgi:hypothetical protein
MAQSRKLWSLSRLTRLRISNDTFNSQITHSLWARPKAVEPVSPSPPYRRRSHRWEIRSPEDGNPCIPTRTRWSLNLSLLNDVHAISTCIQLVKPSGRRGMGSHPAPIKQCFHCSLVFLRNALCTDREASSFTRRRKDESMDYVMAMSAVVSVSGAILLMKYVWRD